MTHFGLNPHPFPSKLNPLQLSGLLQFDQQTTAAQADALTVGSVPRVHEERYTNREQFEARENHHKPRAEMPAQTGHGEGNQTNRTVKPGQLSRCHRAIASQLPVDALTRNLSESKNRI